MTFSQDFFFDRGCFWRACANYVTDRLSCRAYSALFITVCKVRKIQFHWATRILAEYQAYHPTYISFPVFDNDFHVYFMRGLQRYAKKNFTVAFLKSALSILRCTWTGGMNLKILLGYNIKYLSIWPFMRHPWFPTRKASKLTFVCFQLPIIFPLDLDKSDKNFLHQFADQLESKILNPALWLVGQHQIYGGNYKQIR